MRSFTSLAFLALPLFSTVFAEAPASPTKKVEQSIYSSAHDAFQDLLSVLPEESLQAALSGLKDFKNGVFESHSRGVEHVHHSNPALATKLIVAAVQDLKKRQTNSNGTTTEPQQSTEQQTTEQKTTQQTTEQKTTEQKTTQQTTEQTTEQKTTEQKTTQQTTEQKTTEQKTEDASTAEQTQKTTGGETTADKPATTATATVTTTKQRPALVPVEATVTEGGKTVVKTTAVLSEVTASVAVTVVSTNAQGSTVTQTENRPAIIKTTTDSAGRTTVTTSAGNLQPTKGEVQTTTNQEGSTLLTTYTPGGGKVSSIKLLTTTGTDGKPSTITSYAFVDPAEATDGGDSPSQTTGKPGLQTAAANKNAAVGYALAGGAALAFFV